MNTQGSLSAKVSHYMIHYSVIFESSVNDAILCENDEKNDIEIDTSYPSFRNIFSSSFVAMAEKLGFAPDSDSDLDLEVSTFNYENDSSSDEEESCTRCTVLRKQIHHLQKKISQLKKSKETLQSRMKKQLSF